MNKKFETDSDVKEKDENEIEYITEEEKKSKKSEPETETKEKGLEKKKEISLSEIKKLKEKIKDYEIENEKLKEQYLREAAEKDNLRKRTEKEKNEFYQYALSELFRELISILDNFDRALEKKEEGDKKHFREGIELIHKQLENLLKTNGIRPIELEGKKFDPRFHEALMSEESEEVKEPTISEVVQKGYMIHQRLLRPTLVKVKVPKK
ncbi:MAG TPA: nucleotide exchange factor GrpE [Acidobacteriota bacterium]|nr:nucleotide exchange factor GrpE [Acidobacteriota bacterium]